MKGIRSDCRRFYGRPFHIRGPATADRLSCSCFSYQQQTRSCSDWWQRRPVQCRDSQQESSLERLRIRCRCGSDGQNQRVPTQGSSQTVTTVDPRGQHCEACLHHVQKSCSLQITRAIIIQSPLSFKLISQNLAHSL